jgi:hypothetical protein
VNAYLDNEKGRKMLPKQVIADLRSVLANAQYIVGCLPHDEAHRSSLDQARRAIETVERILRDAAGVGDPYEPAMTVREAVLRHAAGAEEYASWYASIAAAPQGVSEAEPQALLRDAKAALEDYSPEWAKTVSKAIESYLAAGVTVADGQTFSGDAP